MSLSLLAAGKGVENPKGCSGKTTDVRRFQWRREEGTARGPLAVFVLFPLAEECLPALLCPAGLENALGLPVQAAKGLLEIARLPSPDLLQVSWCLPGHLTRIPCRAPPLSVSSENRRCLSPLLPCPLHPPTD